MSDTAPASTPVVSVEQDGHVATVFLDRPEKRNAMGMQFFEEFPAAMAALGADREVRAVVVAARGPHFSVGLDLHALAGIGSVPSAGTEPSPAELASRTHAEVLRLQAAISAAADCPKPVVAAVHGYCIGGGVDLASACDIRVCAADAVFSVRETRMAMVADIGSLARLPLVMTMGHVAELVFTGTDIDAARAERIGLVNHVFPDAAAALAGARGLASEIARNSPLAVEGAKAVISQAHRAAVDASQRYVAAWNAGQLRSHDLTE
ncbi:MAG TPA: crotonase/enoyl-CoA hydratase family protein, partial [Acidimicrobiales bacterium]|nr:crotonase/enoyl-CoA hydratase family protein [Acidimicrobiales bacterium]